MPMHIAELIACIIFLYMKIFVYLIKQARLLAIISKFGVGVTIAFYSWALVNRSFAQLHSAITGLERH
jgi:hypothetical protein